jgi:colanic acid biosynthesis protein WcaH
MIPDKYFKIIVKYTPLISVDLIVKHRDEVLLGKRVNKPAKDYYFTPGGIIRKNETINDAIIRIAKMELNIKLKGIPKR